MKSMNTLFPVKFAGFHALPGALLAVVAALALATPSQAFSRPGEFGAEAFNAPLSHSSFSGSGPMGSFSQHRNLVQPSFRGYAIDEIVVKGKRIEIDQEAAMRAWDKFREFAQQRAMAERACFDSRSILRKEEPMDEATSAAIRRAAMARIFPNSQRREEGDAVDAEFWTAEGKALAVSGTSALITAVVTRSPGAAARVEKATYAGILGFFAGHVSGRVMDAAIEDDPIQAAGYEDPSHNSFSAAIPKRGLSPEMQLLMDIEAAFDDEGKTENSRRGRRQGIVRGCR